MFMSNEKQSLSLSVLMPVYNEVYTVAETIKRVLLVKSPYISSLELIVVDDGSTDGTRDVLRVLQKDYPEYLIYIEHDKNRGKGAALRTAIERAKNDVCVVQDADLEYNPDEFHKLMVPFVRENADVVFGSRFLVGDYSRLLYFRHALINRLLTFITNIITDVNFTDMETCYKAVRTKLLKSIPIRASGFDFEPEISIKLAKRGAHIFEVPISYSGRTREEGKKIGWKDGVAAFATLIKFAFIDDLYMEDKFGSHILSSLTQAPNFSKWMADTVQPFVGKEVLEIGAGIGNLTRFFTPRFSYVASDINNDYLDYLNSYAKNKPFLDVKKIDVSKPVDFADIQGKFDTVICLNVLEHIKEDLGALRNLYGALKENGKAVILAPQHEWLFSSLDKVLEHQRRYSAKQLVSVMENAGFEVEKTITGFNKIGILSWYINGILLKRKHFSKLQLKILNVLTPLFRLMDLILPWGGLSVICIGVKTQKSGGK